MRGIFNVYLVLTFLVCSLCCADEDIAMAPGKCIRFPGLASVLESSSASALPSVLDKVRTPPIGNSARRKTFHKLLISQGAAPEEIVSRAVSGTADNEYNVLAVVPGSGKGTIVVGAHIDAMPDSSGAIDNWSGCVMVTALYGKMRQTNPDKTFIFIGFGSEEHGCQGSQQFVQSLDEQTRVNILAMVNLDCIGVSTVRTWVNRSSDSLEKTLKLASRETHVPSRRQVLFGYMADAFSFDKAGIPAITIHSLSPSELQYINGPQDTPDLLSMSQYRKTYRLLSRYLELLDESDGKFAPADRERPMLPISENLTACATQRPCGLMVNALPFSTPEFRAGLRSNDIVTAIAGNPVAGLRDTIPLLQTFHKGQKVDLTVTRRLRNGSSTQISVRVAY